MFATPIIRVALLLATCLPFLASGRSLPRSISTTSATVNAGWSSGNHYPRAVYLSDGTVLLGHGHVDASTSTLEILRSTDGGSTFSTYGTVSERTASGTDMDNIFLLEVGSTSPPTVLAAFRNHDKSGSTYTYFRITVCKSTDGGATWSFLSQAVEYTATADSSGFRAGVWEPFMRIGNDGNIQLTYSQELASLDQQTYRTISSDGGATWSTAVNLNVHNSNTEQVRDGMQGIVKTTDQATGQEALVMVFETTERGVGLFSVWYAVSYDDGATYSNRNAVYSPSASDRHAGSPQIVAVPGGNRLAVVFMDDENVSTVSWADNAEVRTVISSSTGLSGGTISWETSTDLVGSANSHWPGIVNFNSKVLAIFDDNTGAIEGKYITWS